MNCLRDNSINFEIDITDTTVLNNNYYCCSFVIMVTFGNFLNFAYSDIGTFVDCKIYLFNNYYYVTTRIKYYKAFSIVVAD